MRVDKQPKCHQSTGHPVQRVGPERCAYSASPNEKCPEAFRLNKFAEVKTKRQTKHKVWAVSSLLPRFGQSGAAASDCLRPAHGIMEAALHPPRVQQATFPKGLAGWLAWPWPPANPWLGRTHGQPHICKAPRRLSAGLLPASQKATQSMRLPTPRK